MQLKRLLRRLKSSTLSLLSTSVHPSAPQEKRRSKYFIALKKNEGNVFETLDTFVPFLPPRDKFYADPMLFKYEGKNYIFFEDYDYKKGTISYVTASDDMRLSKPIEVLNLSCHLSFPHIFEDGNTIYMTPETIDYREVGLYEALNFPRQWHKKRVLVSGEDFSDPILFKHNEHYWLFTTVKTTELRIFFAESLEGEFKPHPVNTVKIQGRNAGRIFYANNKCIRPVMDCRKMYGYAMILKEIVTLTTEEFIEKDVQAIEPNWAPGLDGTHTFNLNEDFVVYDGRRTILLSEDAQYSA